MRRISGPQQMLSHLFVHYRLGFKTTRQLDVPFIALQLTVCISNLRLQGNLFAALLAPLIRNSNPRDIATWVYALQTSLLLDSMTEQLQKSSIAITPVLVLNMKFQLSLCD